ncbi:hypothetical protein CCAE64S_00188 [Castellaniella caeni]
MMPIEGRGRIVFGIYHHGKGGNLGAGSTIKRIGQQSTTQPLSLESLIHSQAAHANRWHRRIARQLFADISGKLCQQDT